MTHSPEKDHRRTPEQRIGVGQLVLAALGLPVAVASAYFGWAALRPDVPDHPPASVAPATTAGRLSVTTPSGPGPAPVPAGVLLDSLTPEKGGGALTALPRELRDREGYGHALAIACPSNSTGDEVREVSYALSRRYLGLDAVVRPHFEAEADRQSVSHVTVSVATRQRDGTLATREAGAQRSATMAVPQPLTADLEGGDVLTIRVRCAAPTGLVVLGEARLTPA